MVRSKTRSSWDMVKNDRSRHVTFRKRKHGLFKKAHELKTLCDVKVCVVIYASKSDGRLLQPEIFPEQDEEVKQIFNRYASSQSKKVHTLDNFCAEKITELRQETKKLRQKNDEIQFPTCDDRIDALSLDQLHSLAQKLDHKIEAARRTKPQYPIHENMPLHFANISGSTVMYNNGSALQESAQGLFYDNLDRRMLGFNHQMLTFEHPSDNGWNRSAGMTPLADCYNDQYAPLTISDVPPNCLDATFHCHAAPYPMSTSALFPSPFVSSHKLPVSLGFAMQPSLENINASSFQSPEDLRRLESNICSIHNRKY